MRQKQKRISKIQVWRIKNSGHHPKVKWEIVKKNAFHIAHKQSAVYYA